MPVHADLNGAPKPSERSRRSVIPSVPTGVKAKARVMEQAQKESARKMATGEVKRPNGVPMAAHGYSDKLKNKKFERDAKAASGIGRTIDSTLFKFQKEKQHRGSQKASRPSN